MRRARPVARMEARSAEVSRAAWMPHGEDIHDPGVALEDRKSVV